MASERVIFSSVPVNTTVLPEIGEAWSTASSGSGVTSSQQVLDHVDIMLLGEEIGDGLGDRRADLLDIVELGEGLAFPVRPPPARIALRKASADP